MIINRKDQNFVFRVKNNLTRNEYIANSKFWDYKILTYFVSLYIKNRSATIIQQTYRLWQKRISSAKIIQHAVIKWLYRVNGPFVKHAQDRYYQSANKLENCQ